MGRVMLINETLTDIVYHYTSLDNGLKILSDNKFILTPSIINDEENHINKSKFYFFSTARSKITNFKTSRSNLSVCLTLNGRKLSQKYSSKPVDYFQLLSKTKRINHEFEDRLITNEHTIKNVVKYIIQIEILLFDEVRPSLLDMKKIIKMIILAKSYNIPIVLYKNKKDFFGLTKNKNTWTLKEIKKLFSEIKMESPPISKKIILHKNGGDSDVIKSLIALYYVDSVGKLTIEDKDILYELKLYPLDLVTYLKEYINKNPRNKYIKRLITIFKKEKIKSIKEFIIFLNRKWMKT